MVACCGNAYPLLALIGKFSVNRFNTLLILNYLQKFASFLCYLVGSAMSGLGFFHIAALDQEPKDALEGGVRAGSAYGAFFQFSSAKRLPT
jgi:hypothetical protein